jgi:hypothetical protein
VTAIEDASRGTRLVLAAFLAVPVALGVTAVFPQGARPPVFVVGLAVIAGLGVWGGLLARRALLAGTERTGRTILVGIAGLTLGVVAALSCLSATVTALF